MDLKDYELLPGTVVTADDSEHLGRIKVSIPVYENLANANIESLPWCYPISMTGTFQGFSKLTNKSKVWVLKNKTNEYELWYWPMFDLHENTQDLIDSSYENSDVILSRNVGDKNIFVYYSDNEGLVLNINKAKILIDKEENITLNDKDGSSIKIKNGKIFLNTDSEDVKLVRADKIASLISSLKTMFTQMQACAVGPLAPFNGPLSQISQMLTNYNTQDKIGTNNIYCD